MTMKHSSQEKRRVLVAGSTQGVFGGIEVFMLALSEYLNDHPHYTCETVFKLVEGYSTDASFEAMLAESPLKVRICKRGDSKIRELIRHADVVHVQNFPPDIIFPALFMKKRIIATQHNWKRKQLTPHQILWNLAHKLVHHVTYNSFFVAQTWEKPGRRQDRYSVIPTISRLPKVEPNFTKPRVGFSFISRWIPNKGVDLLINAYARANIDHQAWPLKMMGSGPLKEKWLERQSSNPIPGLQILGYVSESEKYEIIASTRWIIVPPHTKEDMGLTPIEGRVVGVPSIASDDGGVPESAGSSAILFKAANEDALVDAIEEAASTTDEQYWLRARECHESLEDHLKPLSIYTKWY